MRTYSATFCLLLTSLFGGSAEAQVYGNSRPQASAHSGLIRRAGTGIGTFSIGRGGRYQSSPRVIVSGPTLTQSSRRRVYSNSQPSFNSYGRTRNYSVNSRTVPSRSYLTTPVIPQVYLNYNMSPNWPWNYSALPLISTPPIVVPWGGLGVPGLPVNPWPQTTIITPFPSAPMTTIQPQPIPAPAVSIPEPTGIEQIVSEPIPVDDRLINNEFPAAIVDETATPAVDRIRSLRYQASGDNAFRNSEYSSAEVFYGTAMRTAPERRAPRIRLAWSQVAQGRFAEAVINLKKGLRILKDPTTAWIEGHELYGDQLRSTARIHHDSLLKWLEQRPRSTDRLLLTAAFQKMTGRNNMSREVAAAAIRNGLEADFVTAMEELTAPPAVQQGADAPPAQKQTQGIKGKGREPVPDAKDELDPPKIKSPNGAALPEVSPTIPVPPVPTIPAPQLSVPRQ